MTLREHLDNIRAEMTSHLVSQRIKDKDILYFQLYLICLIYDGYLLPNYVTEGIRESNHDEPYKTLLKCTPLNELWEKASQRASSALDSLFDDYEVVYQKENYAELFDALLNNAARTGAVRFDHFQPSELSEFIFKISGFKNGMSVYNPYAGVGSYAGMFKAGNQYYAEENDSTIWGIGVLRCYIHNCLSHNYKIADSTTPEWSTKFDIVISTPPKGGSVGFYNETYTESLIRNAPKLLDKTGSMVIVTDANILYGSEGEYIAKSGMLDMVIVLPGNILAWSSYPPVVICLKSEPETPGYIKLVDGSSFYKSGGTNLKLLKHKDLLKAIKQKNPDFTTIVSIGEIKSNKYNLSPALYIDKEEKTANGIKLVPLFKLGTILEPSSTEKQPEYIIHDKLSDDPLDLNILPEGAKKGWIFRTITVQKNTLFIGGSPLHPKFGMINDKINTTIGVTPSVKAFVPNEELVSAQYIAVVLAEKGINSLSSSIVSINSYDLAMAKIPLISKEEQEKVIQNLLHKKTGNAIIPKQKIRVATIGDIKAPEIVEILERKETAGDMIEWLSKNDDIKKKKIDAVIINQANGVKDAEIGVVCSIGVPVYILTDNIKSLEKNLGSLAEKYLPGHSFLIGCESDLFNSLFNYIEERYSPEGKICAEYATQLEAAANLDNKFEFKDFCLHDKLVEFLLNKNSGRDLRHDIRIIRDNCIIEPLVRYGYLPKHNNRDFNAGAEVDLLTDRYYKNGFLLLHSLFPNNSLPLLLRATKQFLNEGCHCLSQFDEAIQNIVLQIMMAVICHISELINDGSFDKCEPEKKRRECVGYRSEFIFYSGEYQVKSFDDDYFFAENVHLDTKVCKELHIQSGDTVYISRADDEKTPRITNSYAIIFFSRDFEKVIK